MVKYWDGSTTLGYVSSEFLGDTKEGLDVLRACTECTKVHAVGSIKQLNVSTASESGSNSVQCGKKYRMTVQKYTIICSDDQYCHSRRVRARRSREMPHSELFFPKKGFGRASRERPCLSAFRAKITARCAVFSSDLTSMSINKIGC